MKPIQIIDREVFSRFQSKNIINSEYQFSTLFIWQPVYEFKYEIWNDCILVYGKQTNGNMQCYFPIGNFVNLVDVIEHIKSVFSEMHQPINLRPLSEDMKNKVLEIIDVNVETGYRESYFDYIYDYEKLKSYAGSEYKRKRHELNRFNSKYDYVYERYLPVQKQEVMDAIKRILLMDKSYDRSEYEAYCRMFDNFDELGLRGGVIRINDRIEGVAVGEAVNSDMIVMHMRRCNKCFEGIYPAILHFLLNYEFDYGSFAIVNTQDDMGDENIRKTKLSYNPKYRLKKYYIKGV